MTYVLLFAILIGLISQEAHGYPKGAPKTYCKDTILPKHKDMPAQPEPSPLEKLEAKWNADGNTVDLHILSKQPLKGIFIQARKPDQTRPLGTFINLPSDTHLVSCPSGDRITHSSPQKWKELTLKWKKPESMTSGEKLTFEGVFLVDMAHFWLKSVST